MRPNNPAASKRRGEIYVLIENRARELASTASRQALEAAYVTLLMSTLPNLSLITLERYTDTFFIECETEEEGGDNPDRD